MKWAAREAWLGGGTWLRGLVTGEWDLANRGSGTWLEEGDLVIGGGGLAKRGGWDLASTGSWIFLRQ